MNVLNKSLLSFRRSASERNPLTLRVSFTTQSVEENYVPTQRVGTRKRGRK